MSLTFVAKIQQMLYHHGFDLIHPFDIRWYNAAVPAKLKLPYEETSHRLALLIGNTKHVWNFFKQYLNVNTPHSNPFDTFTKNTISSICNSHVPYNHHIHYSYETSEGRLIAMQRLGAAIGFAFYNETCALCMHPIFGPWIAFRAIVVIETKNFNVTSIPNAVNLTIPPLLHTADNDKKLNEYWSSMNLPLPPPQMLNNPCAVSGCVDLHNDKFQIAMETMRKGIRNREQWLNVRDVCKVAATDLKYSDEQNAFHYHHKLPLLSE